MSRQPIDVPKDKLQQLRLDALRKVKREKTTKRRIVSVAIVFLCCLSLLFSIRVSPTIANYVAKIPGLEAIVTAVGRDKGIKDIVDNHYYEEINVTQHKEGLALTLQGVIADYTGFVLYYDADAPFELFLDKVQLFQGEDEIECGCSFTHNASNQTNISSSVDFSFPEPIAYTSKDFKVIFHFKDQDKGNIEMTIPFTLQKDIAKEKVFAANRTLDVAGQKFTITQIRQSPLKMAVDIEVDENNTMQILAMEDIAVETESGERRGTLRNRSSIYTNTEGKFTVYLQSNYFNDPQQLTLMIGAVHAVPKGEDFIEVDFATQEVITKPDYLDWDIAVEGQSIKTAARKWDNSVSHMFFTTAQKADGTELEYAGGSFSDDDEYLYATETFKNYDGKAKVKIVYFYNPIGKNIELKIPLK